jgi:RNA polymerase sigma-70 factor (ECF subfamily)
MILVPQESAKERDDRWLLDVANGDRGALEKLYVAYYHRLARFLIRMTHRYETVEEIINDTFLVVWQRAKQFRFASQASTWIFAIAYRTALKSLRGRTIFVTASGLDDCPEQSFDPSEGAEMKDWVANALAHLPAKQRLTLELCYLKGHSLEEIARITDSSVGTVKARMFHARKALHRHLNALAGGTSDADF